MKIALSATPGGFADGLARRLSQDGHRVHCVPQGRRPPRDGKDGHSIRNARRRGPGLDGARLLLHIASPNVRPTAPRPGSPPWGLNEGLVSLASLLAAASAAPRPIERVVVVSPASLYGEGSYICPVNGLVTCQWRRESQLRAHRWEHCCPICNEPLVPVATAENHPAAPLSRSGMLVYLEERLATLWALERRIPVVALRYFEMYGGEPSAPVDLLAARALAGLPLEVCEDGGQTRDYIHQEDVIRCVSGAVGARLPDFSVVNIGTGLPTSAAALVACLEEGLGRPLRVRYSHNFDRSQPRHLYSSTAKMEQLGLRATIPLREGLRQYLATLPKEKCKLAR